MDIAKIKHFIKNINVTTFVLWSLVFVGVILRLKAYSFNPSFWIDECSLGVNINNIGTNYIKYFQPFEMNQCAPPLFMIVCRLILDISHQAGHFYNQDLMLRLFPCLCSMASLPLFATLLTKISTNRYFIWTSMAMLVFNKTAIHYSLEFKQYSCEMLFALILLLMFNSINLKEISYKKLGIYVFVFALSMWFSSSAILILFVGYLLLTYEVFKNKIFDKSKLTILLTPIVTNIIVYYFVYYKPVNKVMSNYMHNYWSNKVPSFFTFSNFGEMFTRKMQVLIHFPYIELLIPFLIISLIIFFANKDINYKFKFLIPCSLLLIIVASFLSVYPFEQRLILFLLPMFIIIYSQFAYLQKEKQISTIVFVLVFVFLTNTQFTLSRSNIIFNRWKSEFFRKHAEYIINNKIPANKIIMTYNSQINYYLYYRISKKDILFSINRTMNFEETKLPDFVNNLPVGDYWFFAPRYTAWVNYATKSKAFFENSKDIKILEKIEEEKNKNVFIIHFEKL